MYSNSILRNSYNNVQRNKFYFNTSKRLVLLRFELSSMRLKKSKIDAKECEKLILTK